MNRFKNKKIYFSGRGEKIDKDELLKYFIQNEATIIEEVNSIKDANIIINGYMSPVYLVDKFYELSKEGIEVFEIEDIEREFSSNLNVDNITMAIKISKDKDRLVKLLNNKYFSGDTFINLLKFYDWGNEGLHDNDDNRDVSTSIVNRFCSLMETNHNIQHSPIGIYYTALETQNSKLLELIYNMPIYTISDKNSLEDQPLTLIEVVALNPNTPKSVLMQIVKNNKIEELRFLALNGSINKMIKDKLLKLDDETIIINLIKADNIEFKNIEILLKDDIFRKVLLKNSKLTDESFELFISSDLSTADIVYLSSNESLNSKQIDILFLKNIDNTNINLLKNSRCSKENIKKYLDKNDLVYNIAIAHNINLESECFIVLEQHEDINIDISLCFNSKTPQDIIKRLYEKNIDNLNEALSQNENTPINILMRLQVDGRYSTNVANNETYREFSRNSLGIIQNESNRFKRSTYTIN